MGRCTSLVMRLTWIAALVALWLNCVFALAEPTLWPPHNPGACCPNARNYGYNETQWRVWPGEGRPERVFPAAVGREIMPPTAGQVPLPLPKAEAAPSKTESPAGALPSQTPGGQVLPEPAVPSGKPTSDEDLLTPNKLLPGMGILPGKPEKPAETPLIVPEKPILEKDLPGLGPETTPPAKPSEPKAGNQPSPSPGGKSDDLVPVRPPRRNRSRKTKAISRRRTRRNRLRRRRRLPRGRASKRTPIARSFAPARPCLSTAGNRWRKIGRRAVLEVPVSPAQALAAPASTAILSRRPARPGASAHRRVLRGRFRRRPAVDPRWILRRRVVRASALGPRRRALAGRLCGTDVPLFWAGAAVAIPVRTRRRYTPACAGNDPVLAAERNANVPGKCEFSTLCDGKVYLFSSAETLARFRQSPYRYVTQGR